jgi:hypothetical protein
VTNKWMRREVAATKVATEEVKAQRVANRGLLMEVADVVLELQAAAERLQAALEEYVAHQEAAVGEEEEEEKK